VASRPFLLPLVLQSMAVLSGWRGDFSAAASLIAEADAIVAATGSGFGRYGAQSLASLGGREAEACQLIEAATRTGQTRLAADALGRLAEATSVGQTDWGQGIYARSRALLSDGEDAEGWYREAIDRLSRTRLRPELARAHLLYGEWLRREGRQAEARRQLRTGYDIFDAIGMEAFAERARRELRATGETVRKSTGDPHSGLTPQEARIARLARSGLSNPEIAAQLFLSARTVQYHLGKVFAKLEISSRRQLQRVLPDGAGPMA
jgi:DNA-binding CsgD family transcriptional regulator